MIERRRSKLLSIYDRCGTIQNESTELIRSVNFKTKGLSETVASLVLENVRLKAQLHDQSKLEECLNIIIEKSQENFGLVQVSAAMITDLRRREVFLQAALAGAYRIITSVDAMRNPPQFLGNGGSCLVAKNYGNDHCTCELKVASDSQAEDNLSDCMILKDSESHASSNPSYAHTSEFTKSPVSNTIKLHCNVPEQCSGQVENSRPLRSNIEWKWKQRDNKKCTFSKQSELSDHSESSTTSSIDTFNLENESSTISSLNGHATEDPFDPCVSPSLSTPGYASGNNDETNAFREENECAFPTEILLTDCVSTNNGPVVQVSFPPDVGGHVELDVISSMVKSHSQSPLTSLTNISASNADGTSVSEVTALSLQQDCTHVISDHSFPNGYGSSLSRTAQRQPPPPSCHQPIYDHQSIDLSQGFRSINACSSSQCDKNIKTLSPRAWHATSCMGRRMISNLRQQQHHKARQLSHRYMQETENKEGTLTGEESLEDRAGVSGTQSGHLIRSIVDDINSPTAFRRVRTARDTLIEGSTASSKEHAVNGDISGETGGERAHCAEDCTKKPVSMIPGHTPSTAMDTKKLTTPIKAGGGECGLVSAIELLASERRESKNSRPLQTKNAPTMTTMTTTRIPVRSKVESLASLKKRTQTDNDRTTSGSTHSSHGSSNRPYVTNDSDDEAIHCDGDICGKYARKAWVDGIQFSPQLVKSQHSDKESVRRYGLQRFNGLSAVGPPSTATCSPFTSPFAQPTTSLATIMTNQPSRRELRIPSSFSLSSPQLADTVAHSPTHVQIFWEFDFNLAQSVFDSDPFSFAGSVWRLSFQRNAPSTQEQLSHPSSTSRGRGRGGSRGGKAGLLPRVDSTLSYGLTISQMSRRHSDSERVCIQCDFQLHCDLRTPYTARKINSQGQKMPSSSSLVGEDNRANSATRKGGVGDSCNRGKHGASFSHGLISKHGGSLDTASSYLFSPCLPSTRGFHHFIGPEVMRYVDKNGKLTISAIVFIVE